ncbi:MAG: aromatic amino acid lyase, partial [bacterium]|nr:aromatic amino acid lyase [bacterium]
GGNFHGEPIAFAADFLGIALAELGSISERRVAVLIDPGFLTPNPGLQSGFMIPHVVMSALVSENKTLAHPASVDTIPTSAGQEDHVSMSCWAARKAKKIADNVEKILGVELLSGCQAIDLSANGNKPGKGTHAVHRYVRERLPFLNEDKYLSSQLEIAYKFMQEEVLVDVVEKAIGILEI